MSNSRNNEVVVDVTIQPVNPTGKCNTIIDLGVHLITARTQLETHAKKITIKPIDEEFVKSNLLNAENLVESNNNLTAFSLIDINQKETSISVIEVTKIINDIIILLTNPIKVMELLKDLDIELGQELSKYNILFPENDNPRSLIACDGFWSPGAPPENYVPKRKNNLFNEVLLKKEQAYGYHTEGQVAKLIGFVDNEDADGLVAKGYIFTENTQVTRIIQHGSMSHRIQFYAICRAIEKNTLDVSYGDGQKLTPLQLLQLLVKCKCKIGISDVNLWALTIDNIIEHINISDTYNPENYQYSCRSPFILNSLLLCFGEAFELSNLQHYLLDSHWKAIYQMIDRIRFKFGELLNEVTDEQIYNTCIDILSHSKDSAGDVGTLNPITIEVDILCKLLGYPDQIQIKNKSNVNQKAFISWEDFSDHIRKRYPGLYTQLTQDEKNEIKNKIEEQEIRKIGLTLYLEKLLKEAVAETDKFGAATTNVETFIEKYWGRKSLADDFESTLNQLTNNTNKPNELIMNGTTLTVLPPNLGGKLIDILSSDRTVNMLFLRLTQTNPVDLPATEQQFAKFLRFLYSRNADVANKYLNAKDLLEYLVFNPDSYTRMDNVFQKHKELLVEFRTNVQTTAMGIMKNVFETGDKDKCTCLIKNGFNFFDLDPEELMNNNQLFNQLCEEQSKYFVLKEKDQLDELSDEQEITPEQNQKLKHISDQIQKIPQETSYYALLCQIDEMNKSPPSPTLFSTKTNPPKRFPLREIADITNTLTGPPSSPSAIT